MPELKPRAKLQVYVPRTDYWRRTWSKFRHKVEWASDDLVNDKLPCSNGTYIKATMPNVVLRLIERYTFGEIDL